MTKDNGFWAKSVKSSYSKQFVVISYAHSKEYLVSLHLKN
jgi:hypothetical protein